MDFCERGGAGSVFMPTKTVHTVLGPIGGERLGDVLCHEHVACVNPCMRDAFGERWFCREEVTARAVRLFAEAKEECGVGTIIDGTPVDLGRDIPMIREVAERSGVNIIVSSGLYYFEEPFLEDKRPAKMADFFIRECEEGIAGTGVRPGILKCATGRHGVTAGNRVALEAMSITQRVTGFPMFAHNEHAEKTPYAQLKIFEENGVNLEKVVIGHCSDSYDPDYLEDLLKNGCYLGFDRVFPSAYREQAATVAELISRGWEDKLLVSHDYFAFVDIADNDWDTQKNAVSDRDFTTVHKLLLPELQRLGVAEAQTRKLVADNPARLLLG